MTDPPADAALRLHEVCAILDHCSDLLKRTQGKHDAEALTLEELREVVETVEQDLEAVLGPDFLERFKNTWETWDDEQ